MIKGFYISAIAVVVSLASSAQTRPSISVSFALDSPTLNRDFRNQCVVHAHDYFKDLNDRLIEELLQDLNRDFPFVDWSSQAAKPLHNLEVQIVESPIANTESNYNIQYFVDGKRVGYQLMISGPSPFIVSGESMQPTSDPPKLIQRARDQIKTDIDDSKKNMVDFFLKNVDIVDLPPPKPPVKLFHLNQRCVVELPLTWGSLQADRDFSELAAEFSANNATGKSRHGSMQLKNPRRCGEDCSNRPDIVVADIEDFRHDEIVTCKTAVPGDWSPSVEAEVTEVLESRLNSMKIRVIHYVLSHQHQ